MKGALVEGSTQSWITSFHYQQLRLQLPVFPYTMKTSHHLPDPRSPYVALSKLSPSPPRSWPVQDFNALSAEGDFRRYRVFVSFGSRAVWLEVFHHVFWVHCSRSSGFCDVSFWFPVFLACVISVWWPHKADVLSNLSRSVFLWTWLPH